MSFANLSYWEQKNFFSADVIVVGAGIVGLTAAITLKTLAKNVSVIVLERGFLPTGASTKNAGFACFGSISELIEQEKLIGTNGLHLLIEKRWKGLAKLRNLLGDDKISYQCYGGYELFRPKEHELAQTCVSKLSHFNALIKDIVLQKDVFTEANPKISKFGFGQINTLIENQLEAQLDPGLMMKSLVQKAAEVGVMVLTNCEVLTLHEESTTLKLETNQGLFSCKKLLSATNAFVNQLLPNISMVPGRGQVVVTKPIPNLKLKGTFHYDKGYYYFRNIDNRILLGGGRNLDFKQEETTQFGTTPLIQQALENLLHEVIIPGIGCEIEHRWSGIMAFGTQLSPIIEQIKPHIFVAVRCSGMGIAIGSQTGDEAARLVLNHL